MYNEARAANKNSKNTAMDKKGTRIKPREKNTRGVFYFEESFISRSGHLLATISADDERSVRRLSVRRVS